MARLPVGETTCPRRGTVMRTSETREQLEVIASCEEGSQHRRQLVEQFHREHLALYQMFGRKISHRYGVPFTYLDDVIQEITMVALEAVDSWDLTEVKLWEGLLYNKSVTHVRTVVETGAWDGQAGLSSRRRRVRHLAKQQERLRAQLHREPTDQEVVDAHNEDAYVRFADPHRSGMIATVDDMLDITPTVVEENSAGAIDIGDNSILSPAESETFVRLVVERCDEDMDETLSEAVRVWFDRSAGGLSVNKSNNDVAGHLGWNRETTRKKLNRIREIAAEVLADEFGITLEEWRAS